MTYDHRISTGALMLLIIVMLMVLPMVMILRVLFALATLLVFGALLYVVFRWQNKRGFEG